MTCNVLADWNAVSVFLGYEIVNVAGADFALDVVEWLPLRLDRRVR